MIQGAWVGHVAPVGTERPRMRHPAAPTCSHFAHSSCSTAGSDSRRHHPSPSRPIRPVALRGPACRAGAEVGALHIDGHAAGQGQRQGGFLSFPPRRRNAVQPGLRSQALKPGRRPDLARTLAGSVQASPASRRRIVARRPLVTMPPSACLRPGLPLVGPRAAQTGKAKISAVKSIPQLLAPVHGADARLVGPALPLLAPPDHEADPPVHRDGDHRRAAARRRAAAPGLQTPRSTRWRCSSAAASLRSWPRCARLRGTVGLRRGQPQLRLPQRTRAAGFLRRLPDGRAGAGGRLREGDVRRGRHPGDGEAPHRHRPRRGLRTSCATSSARWPSAAAAGSSSCTRATPG